MKSIYEEVIKVVTYLQEQNSHLKDNCGTIYISTENITTLENLLIHSQKQEKLLELYRELITVKDEMINKLIFLDSDYYAIEKKEMYLEKQIKGLEKEKEEENEV